MNTGEVSEIALKYRAQFLNKQKKWLDDWGQVFDKVTGDFARLANDPTAKFSKAFKFSDRIEKKIVHIMDTFHKDGTKLTMEQISDAWGLAVSKNDAITRRFYDTLHTKLLPKPEYFLPNTDALNAFLSRTYDSQTLSDRVWKTAEQLRNEMEVHLGIGIMNGDSAAVISRRVRQNLQNPDAYFRRVRDKNGNLVASKAMIENKPGRGVYNSAYKNAMRMTRTETNQAFLLSDSLKWQQLDMVTGIKISISSQHRIVDICDTLQGNYPKDYVFTGWHPQCLCHVIPLLMKEESFLDYLRHQDELVVPKEQRILDTSKEYKEYLHNIIPQLPSLPRWMEYNPRYSVIIPDAQTLRHLSEQTGGEVQRFAQELAGKYGGVVSNLSLKGIESIERKARDDYGGRYYDIKDGARNTILLNSDADIARAVESLQKDNRVIRLKYTRPGDDELGYTGVLMNFRTSGGLICEVQLNTPDILYAKQGGKFLRELAGEEKFAQLQQKYGAANEGLGHKFYEEWRGQAGKLERYRRGEIALTEDELKLINKELQEIKEASVAYYSKFYSKAEIHTVDDLMEAAKVAAREVDQLGKKLAEEFKGTVSAINMKSKASIERKVAKELGGDFSKVNDAARNLIILKKDELEKCLNALMDKRKYPNILEVDNVHWNDNSMGYSGGAIYYRASNGLICETQLGTAEMVYAKEIEPIAIGFLGKERYELIKKATGLPAGLGHKYYEEYRVLDEIKDAQQMRKLEFLSKEYYSHFQQDITEDTLNLELTKEKTISGLVKQIKDEFGIEFDPRNLPLESVQSLVDSLQVLKPFNHDLKSISVAMPGEDTNMTVKTYAYHVNGLHGSRVVLNEAMFSNWETISARVAEDVRTGWHPNGTGQPRSILEHEMGHVLSSQDIDRNPVIRRELFQLYNNYLNDLGRSRNIYQNVMEWDGFISSYGANQFKEFVAESFAMALNSKKPSPYALKVLEVIKKYKSKEVKEIATDIVATNIAPAAHSILFSEAGSTLYKETLANGAVKEVIEKKTGITLGLHEKPNLKKTENRYDLVSKVNPGKEKEMLKKILEYDLEAKCTDLTDGMTINIPVKDMYGQKKIFEFVMKDEIGMFSPSQTTEQGFWVQVSAKPDEIFTKIDRYLDNYSLTLWDSKMEGVQRGLEIVKGKTRYEKLIKDGYISVMDVCTIISSAGFEIPDRLKKLSLGIGAGMKKGAPIAFELKVKPSDEWRNGFKTLHSDNFEQLVRESDEVVHFAYVSGHFKQEDYLFFKEKFTKQFREALQKEFKTAKVVTRIREDALMKVLKDGRLKSQFETNTSGGALSPMTRRGLEYNMFSYPTDTAPELRPIYGMLTKDIKKTPGEHYGDVIIEYKSSIKKRTTWTQGDSLDGTFAGDYAVFCPSKFIDPTEESLPMINLVGIEKALQYLTKIQQEGMKGRVLNYTEAQIHGGVGLGDIKKIWFEVQPNEEIIRKLQELGIEWGKTY
jgi:hypothetical protein